MSLLDRGELDGGVGHDPPLNEELSTPAAAGLQPLLVQAQQIDVGGTRRALADLREHVHEPDELRPELRKDRRERVGLYSAQHAVRAAADADVIIHVYELAIQGIGEKPGHEQRDVADVFEGGALPDAAALERLCETKTQWRFGG